MIHSTLRYPIPAILLALAAVALQSQDKVQAETADIPFTTSILTSCSILVTSSGTLAASTDYTKLDSKESGGSAGTADVSTTGLTYQVSVDAPTAFTGSSPTGANDNVTFAAEYDLSGATIAADINGSTTTLLLPGTTNVSVDVSATKSAGIFTAGDYTTSATVRCE